MKNHNQEMLILYLDNLQALAQLAGSAELDIENYTARAAACLASGEHELHHRYLGFLASSQQHSDFVAKKIADNRAAIMELCHD